MVNIYLWIFIMAGTTFVMRVVPLVVIRKPIENEFIKSFLYYVPYVTLAVMTFPAIMEATQSPLVGLAAMIVGLVVAWFSSNIFITAASCCIIVLVLEFVVA